MRRPGRTVNKMSALTNVNARRNYSLLPSLYSLPNIILFLFSLPRHSVWINSILPRMTTKGRLSDSYAELKIRHLSHAHYVTGKHADS